MIKMGGYRGDFARSIQSVRLPIVGDVGNRAVSAQEKAVLSALENDIKLCVFGMMPVIKSDKIRLFKINESQIIGERFSLRRRIILRALGVIKPDNAYKTRQTFVSPLFQPFLPAEALDNIVQLTDPRRHSAIYGLNSLKEA